MKTFAWIAVQLLIIALALPAPSFALRLTLTEATSERLEVVPSLRRFGVRAACLAREEGSGILGTLERGRFLAPLRKKRLLAKISPRGTRARAAGRALRKAVTECAKRTHSASPVSPTPPAPTPTPLPPDDGSATPFPTVTPTPTIAPTQTPPPYEPEPIPEYAAWEEHMRTFGQRHCDALADDSLTFDEHLAATYYDADWVYQQIAAHTGDTGWMRCAALARSIFRDGYVYPNDGAVPGYWNFSHGVALNYLASGDTDSRDAAILLSEHAAYAAPGTPLAWTEDASMSREVAYAIMAYLNAERVGAPRISRLDDLIGQALGHLDQWFGSQTAEYVRPFMFSLTAHALISYEEREPGTYPILPAVAQGADWLWEHTWIPEAEAFMYTDRVVPSGGTEPAPDLNLLIAPIYGWLWHHTGEERFRERGDAIFAGGVRGAWLYHAKQFNQNYRLSFDYVRLRLLPPIPR